ncbi:hypothetical protein B0H21DRAFT_723256 [Amylocystis lapponica]|nr:hypothetical protein B0H21DRAFT_723256 [Amylocystis lapponica]
MSWLASLTLSVLHAVYWLVTFVKSVRNSFQDTSGPLTAKRRKLPLHLALLLATSHETDSNITEENMIESVERAASWCHAAGIMRLTVYDRGGILSRTIPEIRQRLLKHLDASPDESTGSSEIEFPLTPPPSDDSGSRPLSPAAAHSLLKLHVATIRALDKPGKGKQRPNNGKNVVKRRRLSRREPAAPSLIVHIVSRQSGKPAIASAATGLLRSHTFSGAHNCTTSIEHEFNQTLEGENGFPSPDLMIVHDICPRGSYKTPLELHGFPPWQIRLTEFFYDENLTVKKSWWNRQTIDTPGRPLGEIEFRRALDEFGAAEMRLGK